MVSAIFLVYHAHIYCFYSATQSHAPFTFYFSILTFSSASILSSSAVLEHFLLTVIVPANLPLQERYTAETWSHSREASLAYSYD